LGLHLTVSALYTGSFRQHPAGLPTISRFIHATIRAFDDGPWTGDYYLATMGVSDAPALVLERRLGVRHAALTPPGCPDDHVMCVTTCPAVLRGGRGKALFAPHRISLRISVVPLPGTGRGHACFLAVSSQVRLRGHFRATTVSTAA